MMAHTIQRFTLFCAVWARICLIKMLYFNVSIYAPPLPPRYHNFITHRAFVLKLSILQYFNRNNFFSLNFCYIIFCCAGNCVLWYMNHIYDSIQRIFLHHLTHRFYDFFQEGRRSPISQLLHTHHLHLHGCLQI